MKAVPEIRCGASGKAAFCSWHPSLKEEARRPSTAHETGLRQNIVSNISLGALQVASMFLPGEHNGKRISQFSDSPAATAGFAFEP